MKTILTLLFLFTIHLAIGCDCFWQGPFTKIANNSSTAIIGKVIGYDVYVNGDNGKYPTVMIIEVEEIVKPINVDQYKTDESKFSDEIMFARLFNKRMKKRVRVLGNYGNSCRPNVENYKIGSSYLFALSATKQQFYFYDLDFSISGCGTTSLEIKNGFAIGNIHDEKEQKMSTDGLNQKLSLAEVKELIK